MNTPNKVIYKISTEESERIQILKIWFTIMVIFIHSYTEEVHFAEANLVFQAPIWLDWIKYTISRAISYCSVPGYFFISSILLYRKDFKWKENIKRKVKSLMIPYFIFNTLWLMLYFIGQHIPALSVFFSQEGNIISNWGLPQYISAYLGIKDSCPMLYTLWFVRDLMVLNIIAVLIKCLIDRFPKIIFMILMGMVLFNVQTHLFFLRQISIVYFCLGYYFVKYSIKFNDVEKIKTPFIVVSYMICIALDCLTRYMFMHHVFHFAAIITGLLFFYRFTTKITNLKFHDALIKIAKYSFPIYLFHEMNLTILKKVLTKLLPSNAIWQALLYFGIPVIIFVLCLTLCVILDRYFHKFYSVIVGSRKM